MPLFFVYFYNYMHICESVYGYVQVSIEATEGFGCPEVGVTGGC